MSKKNFSKLLFFCLCFIFIILFVYRYQILNSPSKQYKIHTENIKQKDCLESSGILLSFNSIKRNIVYDRDYKSNVYQYQITIHVNNISNETFDLQNKIVSQLVLISAKQKYYAEPIDNSIIKPHSSITIHTNINVIIEDSLSSNLYNTYKLYLIQKEENGAFIYNIKTT